MDRVPQNLERFIAPDVEYRYYTHWRHVPKKDWHWRNFTPREMACKGTDTLLVMPDFMDRLQALRNAVKAPLKINSGYRSPSHDRAIGGGGTHPTGRAVDIGIFGGDALRLVQLAHDEGFTRFGVKQHGPIEGRFIHLDDLRASETRGPSPWIWSYDE